jgi:AbrB family looped-hinge helix DNA binding protein
MVVLYKNVILADMAGTIEARATEKGQVVIPVVLRRKFGIKKGTRIQFIEKEGQIILNPLTPEVFRERIKKLHGSLQHFGWPSLTKELEAERAADREREERKIERWSGPR